MNSTETRDRLLEILVDRYPCGELPYGALTTLGEELGVSRERVRQLANKLGWTGRIPVERQRPTCISCGVEMTRGELCLDCRWMDVSCRWCEAPIRIRVAYVAQRVTQGRYQYRHYYCSRTCPRSPKTFVVAVAGAGWTPGYFQDKKWDAGARQAANSRGLAIRTRLVGDRTEYWIGDPDDPACPPVVYADGWRRRRLREIRAKRG